MKRFIKSASYGGAYDIEDDMFFTKEEIVEFADDVAEAFNSEYSSTLSLSDCYIDTPNILHVEYTDDEEYEYSADVKIDMRKIRSPRDISKYSSPILQQLKSQYDASHEWEDVNGSTDINASNGIPTKVLLDFGDHVASTVSANLGYNIRFIDGYVVDYNRLVLDFSDDQDNTYSSSLEISEDDFNADADELVRKYAHLVSDDIESDVSNPSSSSKIEGAVYGPDEPPESEFEEVDEFEEKFEIDLDGVKIAVDSYGAYEYLDENGIIQDSNFKWAPDELVTEDYTVPVADNTEIIEYIDELLFPHIPDKPGEYTLSGTATLIFSISGVFESRDYYRDEDDDLVYDSEVSTDSVEVDFLEDKSSIDVKVTPSR